MRAEAALATDSDDAETLDWQPMTYTGEQDGADVYSASLTPQTPGTYDVVVRFSTDAGINWLTATLDDSDNMPLLVVLASDDTTAPDAPATITMGRATVSGVSLEWEAVPDEGLAAAYSLWNNNDPALEMTQVDDTHWSITLFLAEGSTIEYKFVRPLGSDGWGGVEKAEDCSEIANRRAQIVPDADGNMTVDDLVVVKRRDLGACG